MSKGSKQRPGDKEKFDRNYDMIFNQMKILDAHSKMVNENVRQDKSSISNSDQHS